MIGMKILRPATLCIFKASQDRSGSVLRNMTQDCVRKIDLKEQPVHAGCRLAQRFKDPRLQALFTFQDLYVGLSPYSAPGAFSLLAATEITDGVFYPVGGFGKVGFEV